jgi:outer membrane biosynthesis protein TonB
MTTRQRILERNLLSERKKTLRALAISVLIHLLIIILFALLITFRPEIPPPKEEPPVELTMIEPPKPVEPPKPSYVDTSSSETADKPNEKAQFESDRDTRAASTEAPTGLAAVPTQQGEKAPGLEFQNRDYTSGKPTRPAPPPSPPTQASQAPSQAQPPQPTATPQPTPVATPPPQPTATPRPTAQLALLEPPQPRNTPKLSPPQPKQNQPDENQRPPTPQTPPQPPSAPGYQPQTRITRIEGNISNRGRSSVAANATPLGRYKKMLSDAVGSRWYYYVNQSMSLLTPGTVHLTFVVRSDGKVEKVRVISNSSNESFASCSVGAIMDAEIPPIPKELIPMLDGNHVEIDYSFTILTN